MKKKQEQQERSCLKCKKCILDRGAENLDIYGNPTMVYCNKMPILRYEANGAPHYQRQVITLTTTCSYYTEI